MGISSLQGTLNLDRGHGASIADVTAPTKEPPCFPLDKGCSAETERKLHEQLEHLQVDAKMVSLQLSEPPVPARC